MKKVRIIYYTLFIFNILAVFRAIFIENTSQMIISSIILIAVLLFYPIISKKLRSNKEKLKKNKSAEEKTQVTYEELGKALFMFIYKVAWDNFHNKKTLKDLGLEKKDKRYLLREVTAALFYLTIATLEGSFGDKNSEKKVFDSMHDALCQGLGLDEKSSKETKSYFIKRYAEYQDAVKEKRGPNWLWPLTHRILNNLRQEETEDFFAMGHLTAFLTSVIESIPKLISEYEIIDNLVSFKKQSENLEGETQINDTTEEGGTYIF